MNIVTFLEHLIQGRSPIEQYLLALVNKSAAQLTVVGQEAEIGQETVRALNEEWVVKLVATREK